MKITFIGGCLSGKGGVESVIKSFSNLLIKNNHSVELFMLGDRFSIEFENVILNNNIRIRRLNKERMQFLKYYFYYKKFLKEYFERSSSKAFIFYNPIFIIPARAAMNEINSHDRPLIAWPHSSLMRERINKKFNLKNYLLINSLKKADAYFAICEGIFKQILNITRERKNIFLIYNPVEISKTITIKRDSETFKLLYVGRLEENVKRISWILKALKKSESKNWTLDIFGDGPNREELQFLSKSLKISKKVKWHGFCENPWEKINEASLVISTSKFEGFGLSIVEAMKYGIPVLSSNCPVGPSEIVINNVNGWLFNYKNYDSFSNILNNILTGRIQIPDKKVVIDSVKKFDSLFAYNKFIKTIDFLIN